MLKVGAVVGSLALYGIVIDIAVETYQSGSALRWWGVGAAAVLSVLGILVCRRLSAVFIWFLFLATVFSIVAAAAWVPFGLESGFHAFRLSTGDLYTSFFVFLISVSLVVLSAWRRVPVEVRVLLVVVTLYALAPFVLALTRTPQSFISLFHGESFWRSLPTYFQGSFAAVFVVFPLVLVRLLMGIKKLFRSDGGVLLTSTLLLIVSGEAVGLAAIRAPMPVEAPRTAPPQAPAPQTPPPAANPRTDPNLVPTPTPVPTAPVGGLMGIAKSASQSTAQLIDQTVTGSPAALPASPTPTPVAASAQQENAPSAASPGTSSTVVGAWRTEVKFVRTNTPAEGTKLEENAFFDSDPRASADITITPPAGSDARSFSMEVTWLSVDSKNTSKQIGRSVVRGNAGSKVTAALEAPAGGFPPGNYRLEIAAPDGSSVSAPFEVRTLYPEGSSGEALPEGFDIAPAVLGGRIEFVSSELGDRSKAVNLIGRNLQYWDCSRCGWTSKEMSPPPEVVFSFLAQRPARIHAVVIDNATETADRLGEKDSMPKYVEVFGSNTTPAEGYEKLGAARLPQKLGRFVISFPAKSAKFLKLRFVSNYGDAYVRVASVGIIEAPDGGASILADLPLNVARFELGGTVVRGGGSLGRLIDGEGEKEFWIAKDKYLPQRIFFAFQNDQQTLIDHLVVKQASSSNPSNWPKKVLVLGSDVNPISGFEEIGEFPLAQSAQPQSIPVNKSARYLQLAITETYGGGTPTFSEVEIIEGKKDGYRSVLARNSVDIVAATAMQQSAPIVDVDPLAENEPNDFPAQANELAAGRFTKGTIDPLGENDYFKFIVGPGAVRTFSLALLGRPTLRMSLDLTFGPNQLVNFDPGKKAADRVDYSFAAEPGEYLMKLTQPPASIVVVWDTSGSMEKRSEDLRAGVEAFIAQVRPSERVQLVSFSDTVHTLAPDFTSDIGALSGAAAQHFGPGGGTAIYDAVDRAIQLLENKQGNRAIILMTDGADTNSRLAYPEFWNTVEKKRIRVYTIGLGASMRQFNTEIGTTGERYLAHLAQATYGRYFYAEGSAQLTGFYREISQELQSTTEYFLKPVLSTGFGTLRVDSVGEKIEQVSTPEFELILDASGSMREKKSLIDGRLKMDVARDVMTEIVQALPEDAVASLRVFGHRVREKQQGDCEDSQLFAPLTRINKPQLLKSISSIQALGTTLIGYSLRQAAKDFSKDAPSKMIILVTDGKEECGDNPAQAVRDLRAQGLEVRVNVVGFDLAEEAVKTQMQEVATMTGGRFFDAKSSAGLKESVGQALAAPFDVLDSSGKVLQSGGIGQPAVSLPEGIYTVIIRTRGTPVTVPNVGIVKDRATSVELKKQGVEVGMNVKTE